MNPDEPVTATGPTPLQLLRSLPRIRRDPVGFLTEAAAAHGDLVSLPIPGQPVLLVNDPDGARRVLQDNPGGYTKATIQYRSLTTVTGVGLLTADGEDWRRRRRVVQPAFHHTGFAAITTATAQAAQRLRRRWDAAPGQVLDADSALLHTLLDVVGQTLFGTDLARPDGPDGERLATAADVALRTVIARSQSGRPGWADPVRTRRLHRAIATLDEVCAQIVAQRRAMPAPPTDDVLGLLLAAQDAGVLSPAEVRDELVTMVIAGHETVASAMTWALHLLSTHPDVAERLAAELDAAADPTEESSGDSILDPMGRLARLPYTRAVFDEALRLYPPAWLITRRAAMADEVAGVPVAAGTLIVISPWLLHRRPQSWPDPERFDPERFLDERGTVARPRGDYLPFGLGPRLCIGRDIARLEGPLLLAVLLRGRRVLPTRRSSPTVDALITVRPHGGLPLRLAPDPSPR